MQPELRDVAGTNAMDARVVEVSEASQVVESICADGAPGAMEFEYEDALGGLETQVRALRSSATPFRMGRIEHYRPTLFL